MDSPDRPLVILKTGDTHLPLRIARGDFAALRRAVRPTPDPAALLGRFAAIVAAREATRTPVPALC
jgi:hypothetical protein